MDISFIHLNIVELAKTVGYIGLFIIIFAESGLFFGFFLPGDSLIFTAGLLASQQIFNIYALTTVIVIGAILGDNVGYWFGRKIGPKIFNRENSRFFQKAHIERTHDFYETHGSKAIIIGRFIPIVRTFVPILAGVGEMYYSKFISYNVIGGLLWGGGITLLGYSLGASVPNIDKYLLPIIVVIVLTSFIPILFEMLKKSFKHQN
ncbi:MAG: VTT domain-containing protein [bacterium]